MDKMCGNRRIGQNIYCIKLWNDIAEIERNNGGKWNGRIRKQQGSN